MEAKLKVELLEHTPNPEKIIATAAKLCYSSSDIESLSEKQTDEVVEAFLKRLTAMGHESPIEHVSFTFAVEGVSRTLTHQLVRHRIASYSQQSQRYVKLNQFEYVIPPAIKESPLATNLYIQHMKNCQEAYSLIAAHLYNKHSDRMATAELKSRGIIVPGEDPMSQLDEASKKRISKEAEKMAIEDARYAFPNACETKIIVTMNARTLLNFFKHRCCSRAQWEIRELADKMLAECKKVAPLLFSKCGPSCAFGQCKEGSMSCGRQLEMKTKYNDEVWL